MWWVNGGTDYTNSVFGDYYYYELLNTYVISDVFTTYFNNL